jgi:hypothetical protein
LLFVIVMEVLNALVAQADSRGLLWPLPEEVIKHRMSLYVDDLVIFLLHAAKGGLHLHSVPFLICSQGHQA